MVNLSSLLTNLRKERVRSAREVQRLDKAIAVLRKLVGRKRAGKMRGPKPRRTLSAAARRRIAAAQRARWAKWKAGQSKKAT